MWFGRVWENRLLKTTPFGVRLESNLMVGEAPGCHHLHATIVSDMSKERIRKDVSYEVFQTLIIE
jgi:hypothetical protein